MQPLKTVYFKHKLQQATLILPNLFMLHNSGSINSTSKYFTIQLASQITQTGIAIIHDMVHPHALHFGLIQVPFPIVHICLHSHLDS